MDFTTLTVAPALVIAAASAVVAGLIGYAIGKSNENKRKVLALAEADDSAKAAIEKLRREGDEKLSLLSKTEAGEREKMTLAHRALIESLKGTHSTEIQRLSSEHSGLIDRLNAANNAHVKSLEERRQQEIQELKSDREAALGALKEEHRSQLETTRGDHAQALTRLETDYQRRSSEAAQRHDQEISQLNRRVVDLEVVRDQGEVKIAGLETELTALRDQVKENKLNNMFSVSKSGEKLIRVVRSVQELANELDETSRTVTGGEYSFFEQIKDQRDRETVLSLTGGNHAYPEDAEPAVAARDAGADGADDWVEPDALEEHSKTSH